jgi:type VI secretion system protein ImpL
VSNAGTLLSEVTYLYEQDYIRTWNGFLEDLRFVPFRTIPETNEALRIIVSPGSPLRGVLRVAADNTALAETKSGPPETGKIADAKKKFQSTFGSVIKSAERAAGMPSVEPGMFVTAEFQWIRQLTTGEAGKTPLDGIIHTLSEIQAQLDTLGPDVAGVNPVSILSSQSFRGLMQTLRQQADALPPGLRRMISELAVAGEDVVISVATNEIERWYEQQVLPPCQQRIANRYPFASAAQPDVQLADFGMVFGPGGLFDKFFTDHLAAQVDMSGSEWAWRPGSVSPSRHLLDQFQAAQRVRDMFFAPGSKTPEVKFAVILTDLDRDASRFVLQIDGLNIDEKHLPPVRTPVVWPGPVAGPTGFAFEARFFDPPKRFGGPWAWFRMIDATVEGAPDAQQRIRLNVHDTYHRAYVTVEAARAGDNPFATRGWRQFSCES